MGPLERRHTESGNSEPLPIWMAALLLSGCRARGSGGECDIVWQCASGRAVYTNGSMETQLIEPFGIAVPVGETIVVSWLPGETEYTVAVDQPDSLAA
jgi:hypothetical protein